MLSTIESVNNVVNNFIWGVPAMICIIGVGLLLSVRTGFIQIRKFPYAMKVTIGRMLRKKDAIRWCNDTISGGLYCACGNGWNRKYCRSCRSDRNRRTGSSLLDVDLRTSWNVY